jgi:hypothetical protein
MLIDMGQEQKRPEAEDQVDHELREFLDAIRREEVPDRLLSLARELQARLRRDEEP